MQNCFIKHIGNTIGNVNASYPFEFGTTEENLKSAASGEMKNGQHFTQIVKKQPREEGFDEIANTFKTCNRSRKTHEKRYLKLLENIKNNTVFSKSEDTYWLCLKCGYVHFGKSAPEKCPNCHHPKAYFQVLCENYQII